MTAEPGKHWIALLRGINVGGHHKIPMAELRELCAEIGWREVKTYIQSGNIVFAATGAPDSLEDQLNDAIRKRFGHDIPIIVRAAGQWAGYLQANPFPKASEREPNRVMLGLSHRPTAPDAAERLQDYTTGERIRQTDNESGSALWIHYPEGQARSKITPALLDRMAGSPVTTRNWRTVVKLAEMAGPDHS